MSKMPFVPNPPHIEPPSKKTLEKMQSTDYSKNPKVQEYVKRSIDREKQLKRQSRKNYWETNWVGIITLIVGILTLIATIVFGILGLLY